MEVSAHRIRNALLKSDLFTDQDVDLVLASDLPLRHLQEGEALFMKGDRSDKAFILVDGVLGLYDSAEPESAQCFRRVVRGELVGEYGTICGLNRSATGIAFTDLECLELEKEFIEHLIQSSGRIALSLITSISRAASVGRKPEKSTSGAIVVLNGMGPQSLSAKLIHSLSSILALTFNGLDNAPAYELITGIDNEQSLQEQLILACQEKARFTIFTIESISTLSKRNQLLISRLCIFCDGPENSYEIPKADFLQPLVVRVWPQDQDMPRTNFEIPKHIFSHILNVRVADPGHHARLGRFILGRQNILCLGGGGSRGFAHVGAIAAMHELGLNNFDSVHGVSVGALVGVFRGFDLKPEQIMDIMVSCIVKQRAYTFSFNLKSIYSLNNARAALEGIFAGKQLQDSWLPLKLLSAQLNSGEAYYWSHGNIANAVLSSMSIPVVFPPYPDDDDDVHVDGGILCNLPVEMARKETSGCVVAISLDQGADQAQGGAFSVSADSSLLKTVVSSILCGSRSATSAHISMADLVLSPSVHEFSLFDWSKYELVYAAGSKEVKAMQDKLNALVGLRCSALRQSEQMTIDSDNVS